MEEIVIQNGSVCLRSVQELKRIRTEDFYQSLSAQLGVQTPILPERTLYYANRGDKRVYCIHRPPEKAVISVRDRDDELLEYTLKLPHLYFFHRFVNAAFDELYVYCSGEKVRSGQDMLCHVPLKNLFQNGRVCLGSDLKFGLEGSDATKILRVEQHFRCSAFNSDLDTAYHGHAPESWSGHEPIEHWQKLSDQVDFDPGQVDWQPHCCWSDAVNRILEEK